MLDCPSVEKEKRNDYIDCLKDFLAKYVVLGHYAINSIESMLLLIGNICYSFYKHKPYTVRSGKRE